MSQPPPQGSIPGTQGLGTGAGAGASGANAYESDLSGLRTNGLVSIFAPATNPHEVPQQVLLASTQDAVVRRLVRPGTLLDQALSNESTMSTDRKKRMNKPWKVDPYEEVRRASQRPSRFLTSQTQEYDQDQSILSARTLPGTSASLSIRPHIVRATSPRQQANPASPSLHSPGSAGLSPSVAPSPDSGSPQLGTAMPTRPASAVGTSQRSRPRTAHLTRYQQILTRGANAELIPAQRQPLYVAPPKGGLILQQAMQAVEANSQLRHRDPDQAGDQNHLVVASSRSNTLRQLAQHGDLSNFESLVSRIKTLLEHGLFEDGTSSTTKYQASREEAIHDALRFIRLLQKDALFTRSIYRAAKPGGVSTGDESSASGLNEGECDSENEGNPDEKLIDVAAVPEILQATLEADKQITLERRKDVVSQESEPPTSAKISERLIATSYFDRQPHRTSEVEGSVMPQPKRVDLSLIARGTTHDEKRILSRLAKELTRAALLHPFERARHELQVGDRKFAASPRLSQPSLPPPEKRRSSHSAVGYENPYEPMLQTAPQKSSMTYRSALEDLIEYQTKGSEAAAAQQQAQVGAIKAMLHLHDRRALRAAFDSWRTALAIRQQRKKLAEWVKSSITGRNVSKLLRLTDSPDGGEDPKKSGTSETRLVPAAGRNRVPNDSDSKTFVESMGANGSTLRSPTQDDETNIRTQMRRASFLMGAAGTADEPSTTDYFYDPKEGLLRGLGQYSGPQLVQSVFLLWRAWARNQKLRRKLNLETAKVAKYTAKLQAALSNEQDAERLLKLQASALNSAISQLREVERTFPALPHPELTSQLLSSLFNAIIADIHLVRSIDFGLGFLPLFEMAPILSVNPSAYSYKYDFCSLLPPALRPPVDTTPSADGTFASGEVAGGGVFGFAKLAQQSKTGSTSLGNTAAAPLPNDLNMGIRNCLMALEEAGIPLDGPWVPYTDANKAFATLFLSAMGANSKELLRSHGNNLNEEEIGMDNEVTTGLRAGGPKYAIIPALTFLRDMLLNIERGGGVSGNEAGHVSSATVAVDPAVDPLILSQVNSPAQSIRPPSSRSSAHVENNDEGEDSSTEDVPDAGESEGSDHSDDGIENEAKQKAKGKRDSIKKRQRSSVGARQSVSLKSRNSKSSSKADMNLSGSNPQDSEAHASIPLSAIHELLVKYEDMQSSLYSTQVDRLLGLLASKASTMSSERRAAHAAELEELRRLEDLQERAAYLQLLAMAPEQLVIHWANFVLARAVPLAGQQAGAPDGSVHCNLVRITDLSDSLRSGMAYALLLQTLVPELVTSDFPEAANPVAELLRAEAPMAAEIGRIHGGDSDMTTPHKSDAHSAPVNVPSSLHVLEKRAVAAHMQRVETQKKLEAMKEEARAGLQVKNRGGPTPSDGSLLSSSDQGDPNIPPPENAAEPLTRAAESALMLPSARVIGGAVFDGPFRFPAAQTWLGPQLDIERMFKPLVPSLPEDLRGLYGEAKSNNKENPKSGAKNPFNETDKQAQEEARLLEESTLAPDLYGFGVPGTASSSVALAAASQKAVTDQLADDSAAVALSSSLADGPKDRISTSVTTYGVNGTGTPAPKQQPVQSTSGLGTLLASGFAAHESTLTQAGAAVGGSVAMETSLRSTSGRTSASSHLNGLVRSISATADPVMRWKSIFSAFRRLCLPLYTTPEDYVDPLPSVHLLTLSAMFLSRPAGPYMWNIEISPDGTDVSSSKVEGPGRHRHMVWGGLYSNEPPKPGSPAPGAGVMPPRPQTAWAVGALREVEALKSLWLQLQALGTVPAAAAHAMVNRVMALAHVVSTVTARLIRRQHFGRLLKEKIEGFITKLLLARAASATPAAVLLSQTPLDPQGDNPLAQPDSTSTSSVSSVTTLSTTGLSLQELSVLRYMPDAPLIIEVGEEGLKNNTLSPDLDGLEDAGMPGQRSPRLDRSSTQDAAGKSKERINEGNRVLTGIEAIARTTSRLLGSRNNQRERRQQVLEIQRILGQSLPLLFRIFAYYATSPEVLEQAYQTGMSTSLAENSYERGSEQSGSSNSSAPYDATHFGCFRSVYGDDSAKKSPHDGLGALCMSVTSFLECMKNMGVLHGSARLRAITIYHIYSVTTMTSLQLSELALETQRQRKENENHVLSLTHSELQQQQGQALPMTFPLFLAALLRVSHVRYYSKLHRLADRLAVFIANDVPNASSCDPVVFRQSLMSSDVLAALKQCHTRLAAVFLFFARIPRRILMASGPHFGNTPIPPMYQVTPVVGFMYAAIHSVKYHIPITLKTAALATDSHYERLLAQIHGVTLSYAGFLRLLDVADLALTSRPVDAVAEDDAYYLQSKTSGGDGTKAGNDNSLARSQANRARSERTRRARYIFLSAVKATSPPIADLTGPNSLAQVLALPHDEPLRYTMTFSQFMEAVVVMAVNTNPDPFKALSEKILYFIEMDLMLPLIAVYHQASRLPPPAQSPPSSAGKS